MDIIPGMEDVLGQLPRLKGYTHLVLCFLAEDLSREATTEALYKASHRLAVAFPWLAGQVVHQGVGPGCSGTFTVARWHQREVTASILRMQDRSDVCPSYGDIIFSRGPSDLLDGPLLSTETSLPDSYVEPTSAPVLVFTASWINDGLLLDCAAHHNIMDMAGMGQVFQLLAIALQGQEFPRVAINAGNLDRSTVSPLLGPDEARCDHSHLRCPSRLGMSLRPPPSGPLPSYHYFRFSAANLAQLKALTAPTGTAIHPPSTDDALSAFIWKRLSVHRLHLGQLRTASTIFSRAVDCRRSLGVPKEYMGNMAIKCFSKMTFHSISDAPLAVIAAQLREDVQNARDTYNLRSLATFINEEPDKTTINFVPGFNPETDINSSSWAGVDAYNLEFGPLGKPQLVRRPNSKPVMGLLYFMPRTGIGDIDALLCLKDSEVQGLRSDKEWTQYASYIG
ncbi:transferase family-domain-containing protein [Lipomyces orientalis]|uniref:Transferase family-domain-containing protein n=1 Tax=Lipomyces orientalis TaxID=1233043 RepID=A0ACC3TCA2_9ASCO